MSERLVIPILFLLQLGMVLALGWVINHTLLRGREPLDYKPAAAVYIVTAAVLYLVETW